MPPARQPTTTADVRPKALRPPLKWAGGKRWLAPQIAPLWRAQCCRRLVEPFCGGLAMALGLDPQRALLNDVNPHLVNFYRHLQEGLTMRVAMRNDADLYYRHRDDFNRLASTRRGRFSRKAAELFYYLNRTGYNGLCRFNRKGEFNVPFGRHKRINYARDFGAYSGALSRWHFTWGDFEKLELHDDDFIYSDPPYDVPFRQYSGDGFEWSEQVRLAHWLAQHKGPVVLSNQATERILTLYGSLGFRLKLLNAPRSISRTGDRTPAREVLATRGLG
jgi:DNA adenine methylase